MDYYLYLLNYLQLEVCLQLLLYFNCELLLKILRIALNFLNMFNYLNLVDLRECCDKCGKNVFDLSKHRYNRHQDG